MKASIATCVLCALYLPRGMAALAPVAEAESVGIGDVCRPCKIATLDATEALHATPGLTCRPMANVERKNSRRPKK